MVVRGETIRGLRRAAGIDGSGHPRAETRRPGEHHRPRRRQGDHRVQGGQVQRGGRASVVHAVRDPGWRDRQAERVRLLQRRALLGLQRPVVQGPGARIMVPCICVLESGSPCGRLTRVRTGREHQAETGWAPPCPECKRAGRVLPKGQKRSPAGRANMTVGRRAFFARPRTQRAQELVDEYAERAPDMREAVLAFNADVCDDMRRKRVVPTTKAVKLLGWPAQHVRSSSVLTVVRFQFGQAVRLGVPAREVATTAGDPAVFGRLSRELADGPVGRPPMKRPDGSRLSTEELAEVERLLLTAAGWSQQRIANRFRVSRDQVKRYAAALKRLGETPLSAA